MGNLINIEDIEIYLRKSIEEGSPSDDASSDALLYSFLISAISKRIEKICNRTFASTTYYEKIDSFGTKDLLLSNYPITDLTSLSYISVDDVTTDIDIDDIYINAEEGSLYYYAGFPEGRYNLQISYTAGYSEIPDDLKLVACILTENAFLSAGKRIGLTEEKLGKYAYKIANQVSINKDISAVLATYIKYD